MTEATILTASGADPTQLMYMHMLRHWHAHDTFNRVCKQHLPKSFVRLVDTHEVAKSILDGTIDKAQAARIVRTYILTKPIRKVIAKIVQQEFGTPPRTAERDLMLVAAEAKEFARASKAGLVVTHRMPKVRSPRPATRAVR